MVYEPHPIIFSAKISTKLNNLLENIALIKRKTKSDIIREAIELYMKNPKFDIEDPYHVSHYTRVLTFKTTMDLASRIEGFCAKNEVSISRLVRNALLNYFEQNKIKDISRIEKVHFL